MMTAENGKEIADYIDRDSLIDAFVDAWEKGCISGKSMETVMCAVNAQPVYHPSIAQEWVDVKEQPPALRNWVLVAYANYKIGINILLENGWWKTSLFDVTHWMALPKHPEKETNANGTEASIIDVPAVEASRWVPLPVKPGKETNSNETE